MSTPDQPETPLLTRRQLRELRTTAANRIITAEEAAADAAAKAAKKIAAPLPRPAEPPVVAPEPPAAEEVDLSARPLTRREARQQERLRTASVPIVDEQAAKASPAQGVAGLFAAIPPEVQPEASDEAPDRGSHEAEEAEVDGTEAGQLETEGDEPVIEEVEIVVDEAVDPEPVGEADETDDADETVAELVVVPDDAADDDAVVDEVDGESAPAEPVAAIVVDDAAEQEPEEGAVAEESDAEADVDADDTPIDEEPVEESHEASLDEPAEEEAASEARHVVAPGFGSSLLGGEAAGVELPASFDQLLARNGASTAGSASASNALILSQTPETGSFVSPVAATGEALITGTLSLPESFGSTGTAAGSSDGKDIDASLVDTELPPSSSPTPIAASSAISTIKSADDIIKPPAPEKGGKLMLALVITAGALALALTGVLIVALVTGAFQ